MTPDRYEVAPHGNGQLPGQLHRRGTKMGLPTWGGILFGSAFVAFGTWIMLVGTKVLAVDPASVHAPYWVLTVAGVSFALGGFWIWSLAWIQFAAGRRRATAARKYPGEPALVDYPWHPDGFEASEWPVFAKVVALALGLTVFLSPFNFWAFVLGGPWMVKAIVGFFDLIALAAWFQAAWHLGRALKFGRSRIEFPVFPFRPTNPVVLYWHPSRGIHRVNQGTFTLRCVEEWMESHGTGDNRSVKLVHQELWSAQWWLEQPRRIESRDPLELRYAIPPTALTTDLSADKPVFWELEVKLDLPGLDFHETYLVPVYGNG